MNSTLSRSVLATVVLAAACSTFKPAAKAPKYADSKEHLRSYSELIQPAQLRGYLEVIAHDSLEGRDTGSEGMEKAAKYISEQYARFGLKPGGDNNSFFQSLDLETSYFNSIRFQVHKLDKSNPKELWDESVFQSDLIGNFAVVNGGTTPIEAPIVFAGFGITDAANGVDPYGDLDVKGKVVMMLATLPTEIGGTQLSPQAANARTRYFSLIQKGAAAVVVIPETNAQFEEGAQGSAVRMGRAGGFQLSYLKQPRRAAPNYFMIKPDLAAQMIGLKDAAALPAYIEQLKGNKAFKATTLSYELTTQPTVEEKTIQSKNIVAVLEGGDETLKNEFVILTSHYDHVGIGAPDEKGDTIYNGADDDGSGTVGVMAVAEALGKAAAEGVRPKRSVIFLNVTGEEKGLLGSRYYSDHPTVPVESMVANINIDMIGRSDEEHQKQNNDRYVYIIGAEIISSDVDSLLRVANTKSTQIDLNMKFNDLDDPNQFYRRSDHWNFGRLGVPFAFFFTGVHEDYHRPGDEVEKIEFEKMAKITKVIHALTIELTETDKRPTVDNQKFIERTRANPR